MTDYPQNYSAKKTCENCRFAWFDLTIPDGYCECNNHKSKHFGMLMKVGSTCRHFDAEDTRTGSLLDFDKE